MQYKKKQDQLQQKLNEKIFYLFDYNNEYEQKMNTFIQQDLLSIQYEIDCHHELLYYYCKSEIYQRQIENEIPDETQVSQSFLSLTLSLAKEI